MGSHSGRADADPQGPDWRTADPAPSVADVRGVLIAALSFFLGKQQHFPVAIRGSQLLNLPMLVILVVMIYWLIRVRVAGAYEKVQDAGLAEQKGRPLAGWKPTLPMAIRAKGVPGGLRKNYRNLR